MSPSVAFVQGPSVNWVIVDAPSGAVLIDAGYPADHDAVVASIEQAGHRVSDLVAILLTHGHGDHLGNAAALSGQAGCPVFAAADELPNVRREILEQVSIRDILPHVFRPGVAAWSIHALRAGGTKAAPVPDVRALPDDAELARLLGVRIVPVRLAGHTAGHVGYYLPDDDVLVAGDALVGGHPTSRLTGPQLLPTVFHASPQRAADALDALTAPTAPAASIASVAPTVLPGHGPVITGRLADVVAAARARGSAF